MTDKILDSYTARVSPNGANSNQVPDETDIDDLGPFGFLRGSRERATKLELRKKDGNILAIGYGWLEKVEFDPSEGITLHVANQKTGINRRSSKVQTDQK